MLSPLRDFGLGVVPDFVFDNQGVAFCFILSPPCPHFLGERGVFRGSVR